MSIVKVITKARGTRGTAASDGQRRYGLSFQVITNDLADGPQTIGNALGLSPFNIYSFGNDFDSQAHAKELEIRRSTNSPYVWEVDVEFDTRAEDWDENPLLRPAIIDYDFQPYERVATKDVVTGLPIVNAAGLPFDPPLQVEDSRLTIVIQRNELIFPLPLAVAYENAVNSDVWFGLLPGQGKVLITGQFQKESGFQFYAMRYEIHVRWETWTLEVLNAGLTQIDGSPCTQKDGVTPVSEPVPLNQLGYQVTWPLNPSSPIGINYLEFNVLKQLPFAALNLP